MSNHGSMKCALLLVLGVVCFASAVEYDLAVSKKLAFGEEVDQKAVFNFIAEKDGEGKVTLTVSYDFQAPSGLTAQSTTLYFANADRQITEIEFSDKKVQATKFRKPWNKDTVDAPAQVSDDAVSATKATYSIPIEWLPSKVTAVSASIQTVNDAKESVVLNYYGIMNFDIALPDTYVIESYRPVNFQVL